MQINFINCKNDDEVQEMIDKLKEKYKDNPNCKYREISETFILPDKKWIIATESIVKQLTKRKDDIKIFSAEVIKNALCRDKKM